MLVNEQKEEEESDVAFSHSLSRPLLGIQGVKSNIEDTSQKGDLFKKDLDTRRLVGKNNKIGRSIVKRVFPTDLYTAGFGYSRVVGPASPFPKSEVIIEEILKDNRVKRAIRIYAEKNAISIKKAHNVAQRIINKRAAKFNSHTTRIFEYIMAKVLKQIFSVIQVDESAMLRLKEIAASGTPIVLLPSHRSHIDYIVMSMICYRYHLPLPYVAAGENLNIPVVGVLMRGAGAFFIKRSFGDSELYRTIITTYVEHILRQEGSILEFFIEGGRSRTGKPLPPKMGILSMITSAVVERRIPDAVLVPISIGYDKVVEGDSYTRELLGAAKQPESLVGVLKAARLLRSSFGRVDVNIGHQISVAGYLNEVMRGGIQGEHTEMLRHANRALGYRVVYEINAIAVARPTALVATILLTYPGRGISLSSLVKRVQKLRLMIQERGGQVAAFTDEHRDSSTAELIRKAVRVMGHVRVSYEGKGKEPVYIPEGRVELTFYKNSILHWFVMEGTVALAIYGATKPQFQDSTQPIVVPRIPLLQNVKYVSKLLKLECIYKPSPDIEDSFDNTLEMLVQRGVLVVGEGGEISVPPSARSTLLFLCVLFWPFVDSYWLVAVTLMSLLPNRVVKYKTFLNRVQNLGKMAFFDGDLNFLEATAQKETIRNAITVFDELGVVSVHRIQDSSTSTLQLHPNFRSEEKLRQFVSRLQSFRQKTWREISRPRRDLVMPKAIARL